MSDLLIQQHIAKNLRRFLKSYPDEANVLYINETTMPACNNDDEQTRAHPEQYASLDKKTAYTLIEARHAFPYADAALDVIVCFGVLEALPSASQHFFLEQLYRILKPHGRCFFLVKNIAHLNSRIRFLLKGKLDWAEEFEYTGERATIKEYAACIRESQLDIVKHIGIALTVPFFYHRIVCRFPQQFPWLHNFFGFFAQHFPSLALMTVFIVQKNRLAPKGGEITHRQRQQIIKQSQYSQIFSILTHLTERERRELFLLAQELNDFQPVIVEVGSYLGGSSCFLAAGICSKNGMVYAVDTWQNQGMSEGSRDTYQEFLTNTSPLSRWITPLRSLSTELAPHFDQPISLVFIDGNHAYEAVSEDIRAWLPKLRDGGIIALHDYSWAEGVQRAVRERILPLQIEGGHRVDSLYWTRITSQRSPQPFPQQRASIIICTYRRPESLRQAILSVQQQNAESIDYEILVVDNANDPETQNTVEELSRNSRPVIRYLVEKKTGLHHARHTGAHHANGKILVYLDDDVIASPTWLTHILEPFEKDDAIGCVGGKVLPQWEVSPPDWIFKEFDLAYLSLLDAGNNLQEFRWPTCVYGCNLAIRRSVLYESGGFHPDSMGDPKLIWFRGDGETGLQHKLREIGYKILYAPEALVYHCIPASRLTPEYFYSRAFMQGISDSYFRVRQASSLSKRAMLTHGIVCFLRSLSAFCQSFIKASPRKYRGDAYYLSGRGQHQWRVALKPFLHRHVIQETYLLPSLNDELES